MKKRLLKDVSLLTVVQTLKRIKGLILLPLLAKTLGTAGFGLWEQLTILVAILGQFVILGQGTGVIRFFSGDTMQKRARYDVPMLCLMVVILGTSLWGILVVSSSALSSRIFHEPDVRVLLQIIGILLILSPLTTILYKYLRALGKTGVYTSISGVEILLEIVGLSSVIFLGGHLFEIFLVIIGVRIIVLFCLLAVTRDQFHWSQPDFSYLKSYLKFGIPLIFLPVFGKIINSGDRYVIAYFLNNEAVGVYSMAYTLGSIIYTGLAPLYMALYPIMAKLWNENDLDGVREHITVSIRYVMMFAFPASFGIAILARPLIRLLSNEQFLPGSTVVPIILPGFFLFLTSLLGSHILKLVNRTGFILFLSIIIATINVILNILLVPTIGIKGAAIATLFSFGLLAFFMTKASYHYVKYSIDKQFMFKSLGASLIMTGMLLFWKPSGNLELIVEILGAAVVYFLSLFLLKAFHAKEIDFLRKLLPFYKKNPVY